MRARSLGLLVALAGAAIACSTEPGAPSAGATKATAAASSRPAGVRLGEPVVAAEVALASVAKDPRAFAGRTLATSGTVSAVCQNMGCWMEIKDSASQAHIRMHGHSFFVPKTASGRHARVQATVVPADDATECAESPRDPNAAAGLAKVELDATGVELD
jgi:hypothetical protein